MKGNYRRWLCMVMGGCLLFLAACGSPQQSPNQSATPSPQGGQTPAQRIDEALTALETAQSYELRGTTVAEMHLMSGDSTKAEGEPDIRKTDTRTNSVTFAPFARSYKIERLSQLVGKNSDILTVDEQILLDRGESVEQFSRKDDAAWTYASQTRAAHDNALLRQERAAEGFDWLTLFTDITQHPNQTVDGAEREVFKATLHLDKLTALVSTPEGRAQMNLQTGTLLQQLYDGVAGGETSNPATAVTLHLEKGQNVLLRVALELDLLNTAPGGKAPQRSGAIFVSMRPTKLFLVLDITNVNAAPPAVRPSGVKGAPTK